MEKKEINFWSKSYHLHIENEKNIDPDLIESWKRSDTIDAWRHKRMYDNLLPLISAFPDASWVSVGDGRYGTDSNYLIRQGVQHVLTTNISDHLIKNAKEEGFINDYKVENAEKFSFSDESFDFVLCKESYHHFPRPMLALYEMLRVARKGIILIEPNDRLAGEVPINNNACKKNKILIFKEFIKQIFGIPLNKSLLIPEYEETGNYIYPVSEREIEKVALGLNLPFIAFKGMNDVYYKGVEFEQAREETPLFRKIREEISKRDTMCKKGYSRFKLLIAIILKVHPGTSLSKNLQTNDFIIHELPGNPYAR